MVSTIFIKPTEKHIYDSIKILVDFTQRFPVPHGTHLTTLYDLELIQLLLIVYKLPYICYFISLYLLNLLFKHLRYSF